jgi:hypothetical protein
METSGGPHVSAGRRGKVLYASYPRLPDTFVIHYDCEGGEQCELPVRSYDWTTATGQDVQETEFIANGQDGNEFREETLIHWASSFSESRATMGIEAAIYSRALGAANIGTTDMPDYIMCGGPGQYCPNGATCEMQALPFFHCRPKTRGTKNLGGHPTLDVAASNPDGDDLGAPREKFTISHEFGHAQTLFAPNSPFEQSDVNFNWCFAQNLSGSSHTVDSPEWQSGAIIEGFAHFYATAVFNDAADVTPGAWFQSEDVDGDTQRFAANCQAALDTLMCAGPDDAMSCDDAGGANEIDWAGTLWDFLRVVGEDELPGVLLLLSDTLAGAWDPGSVSTDAYDDVLNSVDVRFPNNVQDFDDAAEDNGAKR